MWQAALGTIGGMLGPAIQSIGAGRVAQALRQGNANQAFAGMLPGASIEDLPSDLRSAYDELEQDRGLLARRTAALDNMQSVMDARGADPAFMTALNSNLNRTGRQIAGQDQGLMLSASRRGLGGGGLEFATRRGNQSNAYDSMADLGANIAGQQMNRYDNAIKNYFGSSSDSLANDNSFNQTKASARDSIAKFNQENKMDRWRARNNLNQANANNVRSSASQGFGNQANINSNWQQANTSANLGYLSAIGRGFGQ